MAAYLIAHLEVTDAGAFEAYRDRVPAIIAAHGGRYLIRGAQAEVLEGDWTVPRLVVLEFPDMATARRFYDSPEYQEILPLRTDNCGGPVALVEGYQP